MPYVIALPHNTGDTDLTLYVPERGLFATYNKARAKQFRSLHSAKCTLARYNERWRRDMVIEPLDQGALPMTITTPHELLVAARQLISAPVHWTQGHYAYSHTGRPVEAHSHRAVCWCAIGALSRQARTHNCLKLVTEAIHVLARELEHLPEPHHYRSIVELNDNSTHTQVLTLFDLAIATTTPSGASQ